MINTEKPTDLEKSTREYIKNAWIHSVKKKDCDKDFLLPYDYVAPCVDGELIYLYYWDTYFTNLGLYKDNLVELAFNNIENLKYSLRRFGCVPNMCRLNGAEYASQPPLLCMMVADYFAISKDLSFLKDSYEALCEEYTFWKSKRRAKNGLAKYGTNLKNKQVMIESAKSFSRRTGMDTSKLTNEQKIELYYNRVAEGESGEDHTPRFDGKANEINPIDLNCYLYFFEKTMANFAEIIKKDKDKEIWYGRAGFRKKQIYKYCYDKDTGVFFDYNYVTKKRTGVFCAACYLPYVVGLCSNKEGLRKIHDKLMLPHGVVSCEDVCTHGLTCQWGYPNVWAPHNFFAYVASKNVGDEIAKEIAKHYVDTVSTEFHKSGKLYEKYDGLVGGKAVLNEYGTPEMLGWTAGVYNYFYDSLYEVNVK